MRSGSASRRLSDLDETQGFSSRGVGETVQGESYAPQLARGMMPATLAGRGNRVDGRFRRVELHLSRVRQIWMTSFWKTALPNVLLIVNV